MAEHTIIKPQKIANAAVGLLAAELVLPNIFHKEGIDQFKGSDQDTVTVKVPGVLPFHEYAWRNDRSSGITFDTYVETKVAVAFQGNVYSAVKVTDEQMDFDLPGGISDILPAQAKAVGRGLQRRATRALTGATYAVVVGKAQTNTYGGGGLRSALIEARRVLNAFNVPDEQRYLVCGTDFEAALLSDDKLNLAQNVGDSEAVAALKTATIGDRYGFRIVVDNTIGVAEAYAMVGSAFVFLSGAPSVPASVPFGATASYEGIALRWVRDYDSEHMQDRSVVNTYAGFRSVEDSLVGWDDANNKETISSVQHFVRAIKLHLTAASVYPAVADELSTITGVNINNAYAAATTATAASTTAGDQVAGKDTAKP